MAKAIFVILIGVLVIAIASGYRGGAKDATSNYVNIMRGR